MTVLLIPTLLSAQTVKVHGVAFDSLRGVPLQGALVVMAGSTRNTTSDSLGRFTFDSVSPGVHTFTMQHDAIDSLGYSGFSAWANVSRAMPEVRIAVPSFAMFWRTTCGASAPPADSGFVYGVVRDARTGKPVANASVSLIIDGVRAANGAVRRLRSVTQSDAAGSYSVCGVPTNASLQLRASADSLDAVVEVPAAGRRVQRVELLVAPATTVAAATQQRGTAAFTGMVTDSAKQPIAGAEVALPDLGVAAQTNERGIARLTGIPAGSHRVLVRRLGYGPVETTLAFDAGQTVERRLELRRAVLLDSVVTNALPTRSEFDENRKRGLGHFLTEDELSKQSGRKLSDVLSTFPDLGMIRGNGSRSWILSKRGAASMCGMSRTPAELDACIKKEGRLYIPEKFELGQGMIRACYASVYLDRMLMNPGHPTPPFDVNSITTAELETVEYYSSPSQMPFRYSSLNAGCGVLVLNTRRAK